MKTQWKGGELARTNLRHLQHFDIDVIYKKQGVGDRLEDDAKGNGDGESHLCSL